MKKFNHLIGIIKAVDCNPNADPETRRPRMDGDFGFITPMAQNRLIRDTASYLGHSILCVSGSNLDADPNILNCVAEKMTAQDILDTLKKIYFDFRHFGIAPTGILHKQLKGHHPGGVWLTAEARSWFPVTVKDRKITRSFNTGESNKPLMYGQYSVVDCAYYVFFCSMSPYYAKERKYTHEDYEEFINVVRHMFTFSRRGQMRQGMWFQHLWEVSSDESMMYSDDVYKGLESEESIGKAITQDVDVHFTLTPPKSSDVLTLI